MEWFNGNVNDALNAYQEKNGIMVVYIYDENDQNSNKFDELWNSFDIRSATKQTPYIAIRLLKNSEGAQQFAQFFPTLTIPVCYILGLNAQPLEVITALEGLSSDQLFAAFSKANKLYIEQLKEAGLLKPNQLEGEKTANEAESEATKGMTKEEKEMANEAESEATKGMTKEEKEMANEAESEATKGMTKEEKEMANEVESEATKGMSKEEKLAYYRKLIEDNKKAAAQKEKEEELRKEIQRRNEGKALAEFREKQREKELRESAEARRKQKEEDAAVLKRLRDQLKADKEERAKRNKGETGGSDESTKDVEKAATSAAAAETINKPINTDECRIQCRFPDGSTLNLSLPSKEPLQVVYDAVSMEPRKPPNFFLVQPYPRRKLTEMNKSLLDHGLTPSSVILVIEGLP